MHRFCGNAHGFPFLVLLGHLSILLAWLLPYRYLPYRYHIKFFLPYLYICLSINNSYSFEHALLRSNKNKIK